MSCCQMGPLNKVIEMIPGMDKLFQSNEEEGEHHSADPARKVKQFMIIMDSMTDDGTRSHPDIPSTFHVWTVRTWRLIIMFVLFFRAGRPRGVEEGEGRAIARASHRSGRRLRSDRRERAPGQLSRNHSHRASTKRRRSSPGYHPPT
jgi:hypothetical protein